MKVHTCALILCLVCICTRIIATIPVDVRIPHACVHQANYCNETFPPSSLCSLSTCDAIHGCIITPSPHPQCHPCHGGHVHRQQHSLDIIIAIQERTKQSYEMKDEMNALFQALTSLLTSYTRPTRHISTRFAIVSYEHDNILIWHHFTSDITSLNLTLHNIQQTWMYPQQYHMNIEYDTTRLHPDIHIARTGLTIIQTLDRLIYANATHPSLLQYHSYNTDRHIVMVTMPVRNTSISTSDTTSTSTSTSDTTSADSASTSTSASDKTSDAPKDIRKQLKRYRKQTKSAMESMLLHLFDSRFTLSFIHSHISSYRYLMGDTYHDIHYRDGSGFNRASTLTSMLAAEIDTNTPRKTRNEIRTSPLASSIQAIALSKGISVRTWNYHNLTSSSLEYIYDPITSTRQSISSYFCNACLIHTCNSTTCTSTPVTCDPHEICSPIHGCIYARANESIPERRMSRVEEEQMENAQREARKAKAADKTADATSEKVTVEVEATGETYATIDNITVNDNNIHQNITLLPLFSTRPWVKAETTTTDATPTAADSTSPSSSPRYTRSQLIHSHVPIIEWDPTRPFTSQLIDQGVPVILRNSVVNAWPARSWTWQILKEKMGSYPLSRVKYSHHRKFLHPSRNTPMSQLHTLKMSVTYDEMDLTADQFFIHVMEQVKERERQRKATTSTETTEEDESHVDLDLMYYSFDPLPPLLEPELSPNKHLMYWKPEDIEKNKMFLWMSSENVNMHTHFDQDHNFFVQLLGTKRFTLWSPSSHHNMFMYPRIHPLWHKSQCDYDEPNVEIWPEYADTKAYDAILEPGDLLYIPPYTWHQVESVTASVSLSTWSHDTFLLDHMNLIYKHSHKSDTLLHPIGRMYAHRLYIDLLLHAIYGYALTSQYIHNLLETRYRRLYHAFPPHVNDINICSQYIKDNNSEGEDDPTRIQLPTARHVYGDATFDTRTVAPHFQALKPEVRDILLEEYIEEITVDIVGIHRLYAFFSYCFRGQQYYVTDSTSDIHKMLWEQQ